MQDLLLLIGIEGRTGELMVEAGNNIGSLLVHDGKILLASSPYAREIGDLLVEEGSLTGTELLDVLKQQRTGPHAPVGALLLKTGKVSFATIEKMVHEQIRRAIRDFNSWQNVDFSLLKKNVQPFDGINLPVHEFLSPDVIRSAQLFASAMTNAAGATGAPASSAQ